eukprot:TRINITY_DN2088_c0_g1_i2.p1 TRINITY_DN2088_c0_g1~~TRINITY_DN2088_c0_g1_i2.p1  ORF type:complete len:355 (+),score=50.93 TRINITY_DN2088_c0_g1_i2:191-1255(+)
MSPDSTGGANVAVRLPFMIDLATLPTDEDKKHALITRVLSVIGPPTWMRFIERHPLSFDVFSVRELTEGLTNKLFHIRYTEEPDHAGVLVRVDGVGSEAVIDRQYEMQTMHQFSLDGRLVAYGWFQNGSVYGFTKGRPLVVDDVRQTKYCTLIARELAKWHVFKPTRSNFFAPDRKEVNPSVVENNGCADKEAVSQAQPRGRIWLTTNRWIGLARKAVGTFSEDKRGGSPLFDLDHIEAQIGELRRLIDALDEAFPPLAECMCHADVNPLNVIYDEDNETVSFIDFEYCGLNPPEFDIANHFCEWSGFDCRFERMPTTAERMSFLKEYLRSRGGACVDRQCESIGIGESFTRSQ